jgi:E3 ubiquitin-protein ligase XIAP
MTAAAVDQNPFLLQGMRGIVDTTPSAFPNKAQLQAQWSLQRSDFSWTELEADADVEVHSSPISLDFNNESDRLQSFSTWPFWAGIQPQRLAPEGFYYTGVRDEVRCFSCQVLLKSWRSHDDVRERHKRAYPSCTFLVSKDQENRQAKTSLQNMEHEANRLMTFESHGWQSSCPVKPTELAKSGFYYSGNGDTVICFSCGVSLKEWERGDTADGEHRRANPSCLFLNGKSSTNEQQGVMPVRDLANEDTRRQTFTNWPHDSPVSPRDLAEAGFYYKGVRDSVQCFFCSVAVEAWDPGDIPIEEHIKHSPGCLFAKTILERRQLQQSSFPKLQESIESMNSYEQRLASFSQWPQDSPVSALDLAQAGFYSSGKGDKVTCFSCGGMLRNWQRGDSAWGEHIKYFPSCQHVQQHFPMEVIPRDEPWTEPHSPTVEEYNDDFMQQAVQMGFPEELVMATLVKARQQGVKSLESFIEVLLTEQTMSHSNQPLEASSKTAVANQPIQSMMTEEMTTVAAPIYPTPVSSSQLAVSVTTEPTESMIVETGQEMTTVVAHSNQYLEAPSQQALSVVTEPTESMIIETGQEMTTAVAHSNQSLEASSRQAVSVATVPTESMAAGQESRLCKICMDNEATILFLPCAHILCCQECADLVNKCPICRKTIESRIRSFFA